MAYDQFGRNIHYLRISLTDHCNFRCVYCMPEIMTFRPNAEIMQDDEVLTLVHLFTILGFDKFRLTGGEPTVRANVVDLVREIAATPGVRSLTMTTNGALLPRLAGPLAEAGLHRVNISLDTLHPGRFHALSRRAAFDQVWQGIQAAEDAGLLPIKLNMVVVRGFNDEDVVEIARLTLDHPWQVRFIEMMPFGGATDLQLSNLITAEEIRQRIIAGTGGIEPVNGGELDGEARLYRLPGSLGDLGFISTITEPFCHSCTRARLTADGKLRLCLLRDGEVDLLTPLRQGASLGELRQLILDGIWHKPWGNRLADGQIATDRVMNQIGG